MHKRLSYADAVTVLGGTGPGWELLDRVLGGVLLTATGGGSAVALSLFDAKNEFTRFGRSVTSSLRDRVHGLGRFDRTERLYAAHTVLAVTAFFDALDACDPPFDPRSVSLHRGEQLAIAGAPGSAGWLDQLSMVPAPEPGRSADELAADLRAWYAHLANRLVEHLTGLALWDALTEGGRMRIRAWLQDVLPALALRRYEEMRLRLAADSPEYALWSRDLGDRAVHDRLRSVGQGLTVLENLLREVTTGRRPGDRCAALSAAYRSGLDQPIVAGGAGDLVVPRLGDIYVDPLFRVRRAVPGDPVAREDWWAEVPVRDDLPSFLAAHLTSADAVADPLVVLGQPGAGKSAFTRVVAARLPAADFLPVRVALRDVPAESDVLDQIERSIRSATGEQVTWSETARAAAGALPVVLLDGFDELLQATGVSQSDYLEKVAAFQQREAVQGRPVAVIVTSRTAVADRVLLAGATLYVHLEPFDPGRIGRWLRVWNDLNAAGLAARGLNPLPSALLERYADLAGQPLLLLLLALYDAQDNALQTGTPDAEPGAVGTAELYERLLVRFVEREIRKLRQSAPEDRVRSLVEAEMVRLSVAAFAIFNRSRQWVTEAELDADLTALSVPSPERPPTGEFRTPLSPGQELVGRFFFIQRAQALRNTERLRAYEFLHATFGDFLMARLTVRVLHDMAARAAAGTLAWGAARRDDDFLRSLLSFAPLTSRGPILSFLTALITARPEPGQLRNDLVTLYRVTFTRTDLPSGDYQPVPRQPGHRHAVYELNLILLALACGGHVRASELVPGDAVAGLTSAAHGWRAALDRQEWQALMSALTVRRVWRENRRDVVISLAGTDDVADLVDPLWTHNFPSGHPIYGPPANRGFGYVRIENVSRSLQLTSDLGEDVLRHALEPISRRMEQAVTHFVIHSSDGDAESVAHSLSEVWCVSASQAPGEALVRAYRRCVAAVTGRTWGRPRSDAARSALALLLTLLVRDAGRLPVDAVERFVTTIAGSEQTRDEHLPLILDCLREMAPVSDVDRLVQRRLVDLVTASLTAAATADWDAPSRLRLWLVLAELDRPALADRVAGPVDAAAAGADRALRRRLEQILAGP